MNQTLVVSYQNPSEETRDLLLIEQEEWEKNTGVITTPEMVRYVTAYVYNQLYRSLTKCPLQDGAFRILINCYPRQPGLTYRLHTSWGVLSDKTGGKITVTEIINFTLSTEERPKYPVHEIKSVSWLDVCYDSTGAVIPNPSISVEQDTITVPLEVYGAVEVRYVTERYQHTLTIPKREESLEEFFSAAVYALYQGGISWLEIDLPDSFDENLAVDDCGLGGSSSVTWPEGDPRAVSDDPYQRYTIVDYCSQEIISDSIT